MIPKVDIGIACSGAQSPAWWSSVFSNLIQEIRAGGWELGQVLTISSALPDHNKNHAVGGAIANVEEKRRNQLTDANRAVLSNRFLTGSESGWRADWLMQIDDDTVPPEMAVTDLLNLQKDFAAGVYFNANPPYNPIAYVRDQSGVGYQAVYDYPAGMLTQVDSVGMGCTLIHRSVFERIQDGHTLFQRPNGTLVPVLSSKVHRISPMFGRGMSKENSFVADEWYCERLSKPSADDNRPWPFYAMEYGRTEDHWFCELAAAVGVRPWLDTTILCNHIKSKGTEYADYQREIASQKGLASDPYRSGAG